MRYVARRIAWAMFVVWATVSIAFLVNSALPSDPARMIAGQQAPPAAVAKLRKQLQLDRPVWARYVQFVRRLVHTRGSGDDHATCASFGPVHVDLGRSYQQRRAVTTVLAERAPRTLLLAFTAALVQAGIGTLAGAYAATRKKQRADRVTVAMSLVGVSAPTFLVGLFLQWLLGAELRWLPINGYGDTMRDHLLGLVMPALTLGIFGASYYTRIVRDEMIGELAQDYVRTARAKGASGLAVVVRHALRNALMPIVTVFGLELGALVGGAIVTESVFRWPGLGSLSVDAMLDRDGPLIMGCVIVTSSAVVLSNLLVDLSYLFLDPRLRR